MSDTSIGLVPESTGPRARVLRRNIGGVDVDEQVVAYAPMNSYRDNTTTAGYVYFGQAIPGTATSAASFRIGRLNLTTGSFLLAGTGDFNQVWDNRASLTYA
jgi:hypothetical protein